MTSEDESRLKVLCEHYVMGVLTAGQLDELEQLVRKDDDARLVFLTYVEVHTGQGWEARRRGWGAACLPGNLAMLTASRAGETGGNQDRRPLSRVSGLWWTAVFAVVLALGAGLWFGLRWPVYTDEPLAVVRAVRHASWNGGREMMVGTEVPQGVLDMQSGLVELETRSHVTLVLEGPARLRLHDALHATLIRGNLVVRMAKGESGFVVSAPQMKVTDLGTEFGISATPEGESQVQVYEGKVRAEPGNAQAWMELVAGQMLSRQAGGGLTPGTFRADRFIRTFPPRQPGEVDGGALYNRSRLESVEVAALPGGTASQVRVDGRLDEWGRAGAFRSACEPPFAETYYVEGRMMYDATHLYLAAHVGDPVPMRNAGTAREGMEFAGGSVIVRLATDRKLGWPLKGSWEEAAISRHKGQAPLPDSVSDRIANIIMRHDVKEGTAHVKFAYGFDSHGNIVDPPGWQGAFRKDLDGRGYTLEYAIPWQLLHAEADPPRAGDALGALWMVHWSDADGLLCRGQLVDMTRPGFNDAPTRKVSPGSYFQYGGAWGRAVFLPEAGSPLEKE